jgi:hypothetical protein
MPMQVLSAIVSPPANAAVAAGAAVPVKGIIQRFPSFVHSAFVAFCCRLLLSYVELL